MVVVEETKLKGQTDIYKIDLEELKFTGEVFAQLLLKTTTTKKQLELISQMVRLVAVEEVKLTGQTVILICVYLKCF